MRNLFLDKQQRTLKLNELIIQFSVTCRRKCKHAYIAAGYPYPSRKLCGYLNFRGSTMGYKVSNINFYFLTEGLVKIFTIVSSGFCVTSIKFREHPSPKDQRFSYIGFSLEF